MSRSLQCGRSPAVWDTPQRSSPASHSEKPRGTRCVDSASRCCHWKAKRKSTMWHHEDCVMVRVQLLNQTPNSSDIDKMTTPQYTQPRVNRVALPCQGARPLPACSSIVLITQLPLRGLKWLLWLLPLCLHSGLAGRRDEKEGPSSFQRQDRMFRASFPFAGHWPAPHHPGTLNCKGSWEGPTEILITTEEKD